MDETEVTLTPVVGASSVKEFLTKQAYTVSELMRMTGMTRKQVAYWAEIGLVTPTVRDNKAPKGQPALFYAGTEVVKALIACELRRAGFSPRQVQQVARNLREHDIHLYESEAYLLTDGYSVYYAFSNEEVVDVLKHQRQMLLLLPIHEQIAKLRKVA